MKKSLYEIETIYERKAYRGKRLRDALKRDKIYQKILKERRKNLGKKFKATNKEKERYTLADKRDFEILNKIKELEKKKLSKGDMELTKLIKSQLEYDWRTPLLKTINKLLKNVK